MSNMSRHVEVCTQVSNLLGGVSLDDDMVKEHMLPKLQKEDIMLDFVHIDEHGGPGGVANGTALTTVSDGLSLIDQVRPCCSTGGFQPPHRRRSLMPGTTTLVCCLAVDWSRCHLQTWPSCKPHVFVTMTVRALH